MLRSIDEFLRYFDGVHRRTLRDVLALPPAADGWAPAAGQGEGAWSINALVGHLAAARLFFAGAFLGDGWVFPPAPDTSTRECWGPALEESAAELRRRLAGAPDHRLTRRLPLMDPSTSSGQAPSTGSGQVEPGDIAGWRVLLMLVEHEVHHRSQIDTYAGLQSWDVPQIFGRTWEEVTGRHGPDRS